MLAPSTGPIRSDLIRRVASSLVSSSHQVLDELRYLEDYFMGLQKQGKPVVELYEKVGGGRAGRKEPTRHHHGVA